MTKRDISSHITIKCLNPVVEVVETDAVKWFVRVRNASVKGSCSVGFAFELLAAQASLYIVVDSFEHVWHVVMSSDCQVSSLCPLVVA